MTASCPHRYFLASFVSNERAIEQYVPGNWRVKCGHCGLGLAGSVGSAGGTTEIIWRQTEAWFGSFEVPPV